jgi:hypothetical protein
MMHRRWTPLLVWAAMLAVLTAIVFVFSVNPYYWALHGAAAVATALLAGYYLWRPPLRPAEYVPDASYATVAVAAGAAIAVIGVPFGPWLYLPGLGLLGAGLGGVVNELRVERRHD